jgi:outer membrane lipoprotein-sorting protein
MKSLARKLRRSLLLPSLLLGLAAPAFAQDTPPGQEITPEAKAVLDRMSAAMKDLQAYTIKAHGTRDEVIDHGYKLQHNETASLSVQRPNKMRAEVTGDLRNREFVYDGKTIVVHSPDDNAYASTPATDTLGTLIGELLDSGVELPLIDDHAAETAAHRRCHQRHALEPGALQQRPRQRFEAARRDDDAISALQVQPNPLDGGRHEHLFVATW